MQPPYLYTPWFTVLHILPLVQVNKYEHCRSLPLCLSPLSHHIKCSTSWYPYVARSSQYKALQLINFYLRQVYTNVQSSDMPHGQSGQSLDFHLYPRSHPISLCPASSATFQANSDVLYTRWAGQCYTNWQCGPQTRKSIIMLFLCLFIFSASLRN